MYLLNKKDLSSFVFVAYAIKWWIRRRDLQTWANVVQFPMDLNKILRLFPIVSKNKFLFILTNHLTRFVRVKFVVTLREIIQIFHLPFTCVKIWPFCKTFLEIWIMWTCFCYFVLFYPNSIEGISWSNLCKLLKRDDVKIYIPCFILMTSFLFWIRKDKIWNFVMCSFMMYFSFKGYFFVLLFIYFHVEVTNKYSW